MSRHIFRTRHDDEEIEVVMGWDKPLQGFFMYIEEQENGKLLYDNLEQNLSHPATLDPYLDVLDSMKISVPPEMLREVEKDGRDDAGNRVVEWGKDGKPLDPEEIDQPRAPADVDEEMAAFLKQVSPIMHAVGKALSGQKPSAEEISASREAFRGIEEMREAAQRREQQQDSRNALSGDATIRPEINDGSEKGQLTADQVQARFDDPALQARYQPQDQQKASAPSKPETAESSVARGNIPAEKQVEHSAAKENATKQIITRDGPAERFERIDEFTRGTGKGDRGDKGGRGGRGR